MQNVPEVCTAKTGLAKPVCRGNLGFDREASAVPLFTRGHHTKISRPSFWKRKTRPGRRSLPTSTSMVSSPPNQSPARSPPQHKMAVNLALHWFCSIGQEGWESHALLQKHLDLFVVERVTAHCYLCLRGFFCPYRYNRY